MIATSSTVTITALPSIATSCWGHRGEGTGAEEQRTEEEQEEEEEDVDIATWRSRADEWQGDGVGVPQLPDKTTPQRPTHGSGHQHDDRCGGWSRTAHRQKTHDRQQNQASASRDALMGKGEDWNTGCRICRKNRLLGYQVICRACSPKHRPGAPDQVLKGAEAQGEG